MKRVGPSSSLPIKNSGMKTTISSLPGQRGSRYYGDPPKNIQKKISSSPSSAKATNIENQLRYALLRKGINFIEQADIGPWSIDFFLPEHNVVIEADGEFWHNNMKTRMKDRRKDSWLMAKGYKVFHFEGKQITDDANACVEKVIKSLQAIVLEEQDQQDNEEIKTVEDNNEDEEYERWINRK